jgi:hypothetical protein
MAITWGWEVGPKRNESLSATEIRVRCREHWRTLLTGLQIHHDAMVRTTLNIDDDLLKELRQQATESTASTENRWFTLFTSSTTIRRRRLKADRNLRLV